MFGRSVYQIGGAVNRRERVARAADVVADTGKIAAAVTARFCLGLRESGGFDLEVEPGQVVAKGAGLVLVAAFSAGEWSLSGGSFVTVHKSAAKCAAAIKVLAL